MPQPTPDPSQDGVTHINVYSKGATWIGRFLTNFADAPVDTPDGRFRTVEGYWQWLRTPEGHPAREGMRDASGWQAKKASKRVPDEDKAEVGETFKRKIGRALVSKLASRPDVMDALARSQLPLTHYYVFGDRAVPAGHDWVIEIIERLRRAHRRRLGIPEEGERASRVVSLAADAAREGAENPPRIIAMARRLAPDDSDEAAVSGVLRASGCDFTRIPLHGQKGEAARVALVVRDGGEEADVALCFGAAGAWDGAERWRVY